MELQVDVSLDHVDIEGQRVMRPAGIARSHWQDIWMLFRRTIGNEDLLQRLELADRDEDF
jgi:hypothetical protein